MIFAGLRAKELFLVVVLSGFIFDTLQAEQNEDTPEEDEPQVRSWKDTSSLSKSRTRYSLRNHRKNSSPRDRTTYSRNNPWRNPIERTRDSIAFRARGRENPYAKRRPDQRASSLVIGGPKDKMTKNSNDTRQRPTKRPKQQQRSKLPEITDEEQFKGAISYIGGKYMDVSATPPAEALVRGKLPAHGILVDRQDGEGFKFFDADQYE
ncbi:unnamed protein product [Notodromas monacha]|uniref:Uncharacterized protein n=1 Tax=Notodromas monacha TaxID=399045 RepID=A0A7R9GK35_9CRUS|nr:unnamed protein product [Notodromas monacha]CAG0924205.1 unnamed protein product [Notodromas monacha]